MTGHASTWTAEASLGRRGMRYVPGVESAPLSCSVPTRDPHPLGHACSTCGAEPGAYCTGPVSSRGGAWSHRAREAAAGVDTRTRAPRPDAGAYRVRMAELGAWDGAHGLPVADRADGVYREAYAYAYARAARAYRQGVSS